MNDPCFDWKMVREGGVYPCFGSLIREIWINDFDKMSTAAKFGVFPNDSYMLNFIKRLLHVEK